MACAVTDGASKNGDVHAMRVSALASVVPTVFGADNQELYFSFMRGVTITAENPSVVTERRQDVEYSVVLSAPGTTGDTRVTVGVQGASAVLSFRVLP